MSKLHTSSEYLFCNDYGEQLHSYVCTHRLYNICDRVGIPRRSLHKCRKTFATKLINGGVDKKIIMQILGHSDISTTEQYYYFNNRTFEQEKSQVSNAINYSPSKVFKGMQGMQT